MAMSPAELEACIRRITGPLPEHWIEFLVQGPKDFQDTVRIPLEAPRGQAAGRKGSGVHVSLGEGYHQGEEGPFQELLGHQTLLCPRP